MIRLIQNKPFKEYWKTTGKKGFHRKKGPAFTWGDGTEEWHETGIEYQKIKNDFSTETLTKESMTRIPHLHSFSDNPAVIYKNGTKEWHCIGMLHRPEGPAVEYDNGDVEYWIQGRKHRDNGPAVIYGNKQYWFVDGEFQKCTS
ncbi:MAG: hypothetical protein WCG45_01930 [bacterium]